VTSAVLLFASAHEHQPDDSEAASNLGEIAHLNDEIVTLRCGLDDAKERALSAENRLQTALDSIQGLTEQIDHLTQLLAIKEKNVATLTEQLQLIEDLRNRSWWPRVFRR